MPIYEYVCNACGNKLEAFQGIKDPELKECRECHQPALTRLMSAAGFRLKGSGWYETDFKKDTDKKKNLVNPNENSTPVSTTQSSNAKVDGNKATEKSSIAAATKATTTTASSTPTTATLPKATDKE